MNFSPDNRSTLYIKTEEWRQAERTKGIMFVIGSLLKNNDWLFIRNLGMIKGDPKAPFLITTTNMSAIGITALIIFVKKSWWP